MKNIDKKKEKGFALAMSLLMIVVMSIMTVTLMTVSSNEHNRNETKDSRQQSFYAAETGINIAKNWMVTETSTLESSNPVARDGSLKFCKTTLFPSLEDNAKSLHKGSNTLSNIITEASQKEKERLKKYSFEYFIAYSPNASGVPTIKTKTVASTEGSSIAEGTAYKSAATSSATYYTIYSCGCNNSISDCNAQNNIIIPLEAVVTLVKN